MPLMQCKWVSLCHICWVFSTSYLRCVTWLTILNNFGRNARIEVVVSMTIKEGFVVKQRRDSQRKLRANTFCSSGPKKPKLNLFHKTMVIKIIRGFVIPTCYHSSLFLVLLVGRRQLTTQTEIFLIILENCISIHEKEKSKANPDWQREGCQKEQNFWKGQEMGHIHTREKLFSSVHELILNLPWMPHGPREIPWPSLFFNYSRRANASAWHTRYNLSDLKTVKCTGPFLKYFMYTEGACM